MSHDLEREDLVRRFSESAIREYLQRFLGALGATAEERAIVTDGLIHASYWYHPGQGQGLEKLFRYHRRVKNGGIVPGVTMEWIKDAPAHALLDAKKGWGYVAAHRAMGCAISKAKTSGIAFVGVRHSNHFGIAGYHAYQAAQSGLIGWSTTNAGAEMAPTGTARAVVGTNPWGIAIPRVGTHPILLDIALTTSGKGMMKWLAKEGRPMPLDWALTPEGARTTDPNAAMAGALLPMGDYKGYGLSLFTDVIAGVMTGALFGLDVFQDDQNFDVGHTMLAINPEAFMTRSEFDERLSRLAEQIKSAPPLDAARPVLLPGDQEFARMNERRLAGIPISRETLEALEPYDRDLGIGSLRPA
jgi:LDH2 family malate/lactate/ureidoglycolate dehydrogenase